MEVMFNERKTPDSSIGTPQCQFFVVRKKRLCRMTVKPGRQYCGEHEPQPKNETGEVDKRIPCPNDPKHTCYASKLEKHLTICNARRTEQPAYIVENINAPEPVETHPRKPLSTIPRDEIAKLIDKVNHLYAKYLEDHITPEPPQPIHHTVLPEFDAPDRTETSRRHLRQTSALLWIVEREGLVRDNTCYVELGAGKGQLSYYACHAWCGAGAGRVLAVDRAPLRHKRDNKLRSAPPSQLKPTSVHSVSGKEKHIKVNGDNADEVNKNDDKEKHSEVNSDKNGDGVNKSDKNKHSESGDINKSELISEDVEVYTVSDNANGSDDIALDSTTDSQQNFRSKRTEVGAEVATRLRADLAHLALEAAPTVAESAGVVGIAKHLCGVATDYALRCVAAPGVVEKTHGVVLATCCHHRCERGLYVATRQLQELGIDAAEFNIMLGIVSWATCGDGRSRERRLQAEHLEPEETAYPNRKERETEETHSPRYPVNRDERETVGRRAKAVLDWGRVLWLRERGFEARLCYYVPRDVSLENVCLVARKR